ncbi:putative tubulin-tyrosine ligase family protein [Lyophyllum shimeji]|uniref:Tubulin-tyrosine ligase family protein n=1 Tax=Lyophyllum shimeji TaxID=47721 RepID=A0A9P3PIZ2_LYOSH|nr:putative tubulin-tyrosine ligase family protein [Lyophyllum shimeji]
MHSPLTAQHVCVVSWPAAPLTDRLVRASLNALGLPIAIFTSIPQYFPPSKLVQWSSYDHIDHELTHLHRQDVLASSYTFRKAIIRKHFLSRCLLSYITKHPTSPLKAATPTTFEVEISFADELDEMWSDDLWDLAQALESSHSWWILKPGMSDRGMGIRLFNSKESLQQIFEEFELSDSENEDTDTDLGTAVATSQLRHFVIQEYIPNPLLLDPYEVPIDGSSRPSELRGYKFHLRAYCLASGALRVYLYDRILALFSAVPYATPVSNTEGDTPLDLTPHLTNTSLQTHKGEEGVRLFDELVGCQILPSVEGSEPAVFTAKDSAEVVLQMVEILGDAFKAAIENPVHFQPLPNAFELYGIDFLVAYSAAPGTGVPKFQVKLLEMNAEPAIELTGPRLTWILEDLFISIGKVTVEPFLRGIEEDGGWAVGETRHHLIKALDEEIRVVTR